MHIFISGIGGSGLGPLAMIAKDTGLDVSGSDLKPSAYSQKLEDRGVNIAYEQTYDNIAAVHSAKPIDWFVYTSALPDDAPELSFARENGIRSSKRDAFLNEFLKNQDLKLIAVAGTHGKTTTTAMTVWVLQKLGVPISYSIGTNIPFGPAAKFDPQSQYFIYEADEYDRNFLHFSPNIALIPSVDYDHPDTYPTREDYFRAFRQFIDQSDEVYMWRKDYEKLGLKNDENTTTFEHSPTRNEIDLTGQFMRENAFLIQQVLTKIIDASPAKLSQVLSQFPGAERRFERIASNTYSDYAHHPTEIKATIEKALEISPDVVVVYQPHQNIRQHEVQDLYHDAFMGVKKVYWLPTYLTRENDLPILTPQDLIKKLSTPAIAEVADFNDKLVHHVLGHQKAGSLVLILGAGPVDAWARQHFLD
jgi:UDP-N-acetylmuramate--alanine ligase